MAQAALRAAEAPYVDVLIQFMLEDEAGRTAGRAGSSAEGLFKPSFNSFMLPIAEAERAGRRTTIWGQVRPGFGPRPYRLQRLTPLGWTPVGAPALTGWNGTYTRVVQVAAGTRFRVISLATATASRPIVVR